MRSSERDPQFAAALAVVAATVMQLEFAPAANITLGGVTLTGSRIGGASCSPADCA